MTKTEIKSVEQFIKDLICQLIISFSFKTKSDYYFFFYIFVKKDFQVVFLLLRDLKVRDFRTV